MKQWWERGTVVRTLLKLSRSELVSDWAKVVDMVIEETEHGGSLDGGKQGEDCILSCGFLMRIVLVFPRFLTFWSHGSL